VTSVPQLLNQENYRANGVFFRASEVVLLFRPVRSQFKMDQGFI